MKNMRFALAGAFLASVAGANAIVINDAVGDVSVPGNPFPHMDITSVEVTNTASTISFKFNLNGDPIATNWGKYNVVFRNTSNANVDTAAMNNPWGRNYQLLGGSNGFIGGWVDAPNTNQQNWAFTSGWTLNNTVSSSVTSSSVMFTANFSEIGVALGDTIIFDMVTTGGNGGDTAVDSLTGVSPTDWGQAVPLEGVLYSVAAVPEPGTMAVLGLGAAALIRRRRKS